MTGDAGSGGDRRRRLERVLEGYFDTKAHIMVQRALATASTAELHDDDAIEALREEFLGLLEDRYDRDDPGWRPAAESFLRGEFDRQVRAARQRDRELEELLDEEDPPG